MKRTQAAAVVLAGGALAVASGTALGQSSVNVYGVVSYDLVRASNVYTGATKNSLTSLDNGAVTGSRLGFTGSEALGGGTSAVFGVETGFNSDDGRLNAGGGIFGRGAYAGMKGDFGTVTAGRQWNLNDDVMGNFFVFGGFAAFRYSEFDWLSDLVNNSVKYVSPSVGGAQASLLYGLGEQRGNATAGNTYEAALTYGAGPFGAAVTYHKLKAGTGAFFPGKLISAGANYKFDPVRIRVAYAASTPDVTLALPKATSIDVGVDWSITPQASLAVDYVARNQSGTSNDSRFFRLFGTYALSKRTAVIANAIRLSNKGTATERFYGAGSPGVGQTVFTVGMQHRF